jgi:hypothetical protein
MHLHLLWDVPKFWWHAWATVMRPLIEVLGIAGVLLAFCSVVVRYAEHRLRKKSHTDALKASKDFFHDTVWTPLLTYIVLLVFLGFGLGPYELYQRDEQRLVDYQSLKKQVDDLTAQNDKLATQVKQLTPELEAADSLRRRTIRLADEMQKYLLMRFQNHPPFAYPDSRAPNPSDERKKEIEKSQNYDLETETYYREHFRDKMIGIIREYNSKGVKTGFLEADASQRPPVLFFPGTVGEELASDDLYQFRELVYHVDAQGDLIVIAP